MLLLPNVTRYTCLLATTTIALGCAFDTSTRGRQEAGTSSDAAGTQTVDASSLTGVDSGNPPVDPDAAIIIATPDAAAFVAPDSIDDVVFALRQDNIVVDGDITEWGEHSWVQISAPNDYRETGGEAEDADDISARLAVRWDDTHLYFAVEVTDDIYVNSSTGEDIWEGDSLQVAFDVAKNGGSEYDSTDDFEYGWARAQNDSLETYRWMWPDGQGAYDTTLYEISRNGTTTYYEASLRVSDLGLATFADAGGSIGFSFMVNDGDGQGNPDGYVEWTSGIGQGKNPNAFGRLRFHPDGP